MKCRMNFNLVFVFFTCFSLSELTTTWSTQTTGFCVVEQFLDSKENLQSVEDRISHLERQLERQSKLVGQLKDTVDQLVSVASNFDQSSVSESSEWTLHSNQGTNFQLRSGVRFLDLFKTLSIVKTESKMTALKTFLLTGKMYMIAGDASGNVYLIHPSGHIIAKHIRNDGVPIIHVDTLSVNKNLTSVIIVLRNGEIDQLSLTSEKKPLQSELEDISLNLEASILPTSDRPLVDVHVARFQKIQNVVFMAYKTDELDIIQLNGSLLHNITLPSQILALRSDSKYTLIGHELGMQMIYKSIEYDLKCSLSEDTRLKSLVFDAERQSRAYGVTTQNELLYFSVQKVVKRCYIKHRQKIKLPPGEKLKLISIKGYLLMATNEGIGVLNVTSTYKSGPKEVLMESYSSIGLSLSINIEHFDDLLVSFVNEKGGLLSLNLGNEVIGIFGSMLPVSEQHRQDKRWLFRPLMFISVIGVSLWNAFAGKRRI